MTRARGAHRRPMERNVPLLTLRPAVSWPWRVASVVMMGLLGGILLAPGAALAKTKSTLNVVVVGDFFSYGYASSQNAALKQETPPTLEALNQVQAANPGVDLNVLFIPVADASTSALNHPAGTGAYAGQSALIKSVSQASVVIVGLGAGNVSLAAPMRSVLFGTSASGSAFTQLMTAVDQGTYLRSESSLLGEVAAEATPGATVITLGYPDVQARQDASSLQFWSPYSWSMIGQQQANISDQLVSALNTSNELATSIASAQHPRLHFVFANLSSAAQNTGSLSARRETGKAHTASSVSSASQSASPALIGGAILPVVDQAVNNELATKGVLGAQNVPPVTPKNPWKLTVLVPLASQSQQQAQSQQGQTQQQGQPQLRSQQQAQPQQQWSNAGVNTPPPPSPAPRQPVSQQPASQAPWQPPAPPILPILQQNNNNQGNNPQGNNNQASNNQGNNGQGNNGQGAQGQGAPQGTGGHPGHGSQNGQSGSAVQPSAPQPTPSAPQPAGPGQQTAAPQATPTPSPQPTPTPAAPTSPPGRAGGSGNSGSTSPQQPQQPTRPGSPNLPVIPSPPAPIPEPIAPAQPPSTGGGQNPGNSTNVGTPTTPATPGTPASPGTPAAPATPATPGTPATPATPTTPTTPGTPAPATPGTSASSATSASGFSATAASGSTATSASAPGTTASQESPSTPAAPGAPTSTATTPATAPATSAGTATSANPATSTAPSWLTGTTQNTSTSGHQANPDDALPSWVIG